MKRTLFFIVLIVMMFGLSAQNYMLIYKTDGSIVVCGTAEIDSLKFVPMGYFEEPTVTTNEVENITFTSAICGGNVTYDGGVEVTAKGICWSTEPNPTVSDNYTVDGSGIGSYTSNLSNLLESTTYYVRAYATNVVGTSYGEERSFTTLPSSGIINDHECVDLGLPSGLKWASCNIGASSPEAYGEYFAWGETNTKDYYYFDNYSLLNLSMDDISGNAQYDAATAKWGPTWRMPTKTEQEELLNYCTWSWTTQNEVKGYKVTGPNGNSIFLPAAGYRYQSESGYAGEKGYYWSSTSYDKDYSSSYNIVFKNDYKELNDGGNRFYGRSVRPVAE